MKEKIIQFIKDFILMAVIISAVAFAFYKLNIVNEFNFSYIAGFMTGWSIWRIIRLHIDSKKHKKQDKADE